MLWTTAAQSVSKNITCTSVRMAGVSGSVDMGKIAGPILYLNFTGAAVNFGVRVRLAYLFSRYPIVSQTFCDTEILALEQLGYELELYSIYPPPTSFRHGHAQRMRAPIHYAPPAPILKLGEAAAKRS